MEAHIKLGRIAGIQIGLHYSWIIIALLIVLSLSSHFSTTNPGWSGFVVWASSIVTAILFFVSIVLHELSHALVAQARGLPVRSITLFALGGVAAIEREAASPKTEFWMGIVGPIMSAVIGILCLAAASTLGWTFEIGAMSPPMAILVWLGLINIVLAVFNMIPGYPLDGGRILRSVIWWITGEADRSTRIAARIGQITAFLFIVLGLLQFFGGADFGGLWLAFIGWFLFEAAGSTILHAETVSRLRGVRVGDIMAREFPVVDGNTNLQTFADEYVLRTGRRAFLVEVNGEINGLLTAHELRTIDRVQWPYKTVDEVMRPLGDLQTVTSETPLTEVVEMIAREDVNQIPVVDRGRIEGLISRSHILRFLRARAELNM